MPLTTLQQQYALEMLNIPPNSVVFKIDGMGLNTTQILGNGPISAITAFNAQWAGLSSDQQTIVGNIINDYTNIIDISPGVRVEAGSVSQFINGVTIDFDAAKQVYRDRLKHYLPFWDTFETRQTQAAQRAQASAAVIM